MMMKKFFEKITGIAKIREEANAAAQEALQLAKDAREEARAAIEKSRAEIEAAQEAATKAFELEQEAKMAPKDRASKKGEPWVSVVETHVNKQNVRNGFFELDWNNEFVVKLRQEGYGADGDKDEDIIDRWFRELCAGVVVESGFDTFSDMTAGSINGADINRNNG